MGFGSGYGFGGLMGMAGGVLLMIGLVVLVVWLVSRATSHDHAPRSSNEQSEALDILRARFARGEISEAEYTQAVGVLRANR